MKLVECDWCGVRFRPREDRSVGQSEHSLIWLNEYNVQQKRDICAGCGAEIHELEKRVKSRVRVPSEKLDAGSGRAFPSTNSDPPPPAAPWPDNDPRHPSRKTHTQPNILSRIFS